MKIIAIWLLALWTALPALATNAAPLGLELGVATLAQVQQQVGTQTDLQGAGGQIQAGAQKPTLCG